VKSRESSTGRFLADIVGNGSGPGSPIGARAGEKAVVK
jgi:hypothetical protein